MNDEFILKLFWDRKEQAISEVDSVYGKRLFSLAYHFLGNRQDAEECVSDTYFSAWNSIPPKKPQFLFAYLSTICRRAAFHRLEKETAKKRNAVIIELTKELEQCIPGCTDLACTEDSTLVSLIEEFLLTQKKEARQFFVRRYWFGDSIGDIAVRFGVTEGSIRVSLHRTREKLRLFLTEKGVCL